MAVVGDNYNSVPVSMVGEYAQAMYYHELRIHALNERSVELARLAKERTEQ